MAVSRTTILIDLEATCWEEGTNLEKQEIIELAAARLNPETGEIEDEFDSFVRPVTNPQLSEYCNELTSIRQADVDNAETFPSVWKRFLQWVGEPRETLLLSWGAYDDKQLRQECNKHGLEYPFTEHFNLKNRFAEVFNVRPKGMAKALRHLNLELEGRHHRGIDDVRNIARIYREIRSHS